MEQIPYLFGYLFGYFFCTCRGGQIRLYAPFCGGMDVQVATADGHLSDMVA